MLRRRSGFNRLAVWSVVLTASPFLSQAEEVSTVLGCTTVLPDGVQEPGAIVGINLATTGAVVTGENREETSEGEGVLSPEMEPTYDWQLIDVYHGRQMVPESEYFARLSPSWRSRRRTR